MTASTHTRLLVFMSVLTLAVAFLPGITDPAAHAQVPTPWFSVEVTGNGMWGGDFVPGSVTVTVNGAPAPGSPFATDEFGSFATWFDSSVLDFVAGDYIEVSDGTNTKTLTIANLSVDSVDEATNIVSGTADPDATLWVSIRGEPGEPGRTVTADGSGAWSTDFDIPGDTGGTLDLTPGTHGYAQQTDFDNDRTNLDWHVPNPVFQVMAGDHGSIWANDFTPNGSLSITIDGADAGTHPLDEWGNFDGNHFGLSFDLPVGATVIVSDGTTIKDHVVTNLATTAVDEAANTVTGSADPGDVIDVWHHGEGGNLQVTADAATGIWTADFTGLVDFEPGTNGNSGEVDADGDQTYAFWHVPNPAIGVDASYDDVFGWDFAPHGLASVTINGIDHGTYPTDEWGNFGTGPLATDIVAGNTVTVSDGTGDVTHVVLALEVTSVDENLDTVSGMAPSAGVVNVWVHDEGDVNRTVTAAPDGTWTADFTAAGIVDPNDRGTADLVAGSNGNSNTCDPAGNCTFWQWRLADPWIGASVIHEEVWANDFPDEPAGQTLYYRLDDPTTPEIDFEYDMPLIVNDWGGTEAGDRSFGRYDVQAGQIFTVRNRPFTDPLGDGMEKVLEISRIEVTGVDGDTDIITGYADPAEGPDICVWSNDAQLCNSDPGLTWEVAGDWTADFGSVGSDVLPGHWNSASQFDFDGDETHHWWNLPPWVVVELAEEDAAGVPLWPDAVRAEQWTGPVVTLTINGTVIDTWTVTGDGHYTFELAAVDIDPDDVVTLSDSVNTKSVTVERLTIDQINFTGDSPPNSVFGTAENNRDVRVEASASVGGWWAERWVHADSTGDYFADFDNPGNGWREQWTADFGGAEGLGRHMRVEIYDADNDRVETRTCEGVPRLVIARSDGRVDAYDFPEGATVTLEITGAPEPFTAVSQQNPNNPCETIATFDLGGFEIPDDATVTASDDAGTPPVTHTVIAFTIDNADPDTDTVSGTAPAGARVLVAADGNWRYVYANETGYWLADFTVPGDEPGEEQVVDLGPGSSGIAILLDEQGNSTERSWYISNAHFNVDPTSEMLWANEFLPNTELFVTVSGVDVPGSPFMTDEWGNFDTSRVEWDPNNPRSFEPGDFVVVTDNTTTKDHTVTNLTVDLVDPDTDTVSGTADAGSEVCLDVWDWGQDCVIATDGTWSFSSDPAGWYFELDPGSGGAASQFDTNGDATQIHWNVANPHFNVDTASDGVWGHQWAGHLTINVDGTDYGPFPVYEWGNFNAEWDPAPAINPGSYITVTDGAITKDHTVTDLAITGTDPDIDQVFGVAAPATTVDVWVHDSNAWRQVTAGPDRGDGLGEWTVDFGVPGPNPGEEDTADLGPGSNGNSSQCDTDNDCTFAHWNVANPNFHVDPGNEGVWGHEWPPHSSVTVTVNGTEVPGSPFGTDEWGNFGAGWDPAYLDMQIGDLVVTTDGTTTKDHTVIAVTVESVDPDTNVVSGTAPANSRLWVNMNVEGVDPGRTVTADDFGLWSTDFDDPGDHGGTWDIVLGDSGHVQTCDVDDDCTTVGWHLTSPHLTIRLGQQLVEGWDWPEGATVSLNIDDPGNGPGVDYSDTSIAEPAEWDPNHTYLEFRPLEEGGFEVLPGFEIEMTDLSTTKTHTVVDIHITEIDLDTDTVSGIATPDRWVTVHIHETDVTRDVLTDGGGAFVADFANPGAGEHEQETWDISYGTAGEVFDTDNDGDATQVDWDVPEPPTFTVNPQAQHIHGEGWFGGPITITFDADDVPGDELYVITIEDYDQEGRWFEYGLAGDFVMEPGQFVTVTDGTRTKTHWITDVAVTAVDEATDTVSGTAEPGATVTVEVNAPQFGAVWEHLVFQFGPGRFDRNPDSWNEYLDFRKAVAHAIDRDALVAAIPQAAYGIDSYIDGFLPLMGADGWAQYAYDPALAASLIDGLCAELGRACVTDPPVAYFTTNEDNDARVQLAGLLQGMLADVGIDMVIDLEHSSVFFGETINSRAFDLGEWAWFGEPTYRMLADMHDWFDPLERYQFNPYGWTTSDTGELADLIGLMHETDDPALLRVYALAAEQILADQVMFVPLYVRADPPELEYGPTVEVKADTAGYWTADFSDLYDITPGTEGSASEEDDDGDRTQVDWRVPGPPEFGVTATHDWVEGYDFAGDTITATFDDNDDPLDGILYEEVFDVDPNQPNWLHVIDGFDIQPGQFVTVTDGVTTKTTWVSPIQITNVDRQIWTITGVADPNVEIDTFGFNPEVGGFGEHIIVVDEFGDWSLHLDEVLDPGDRPTEIPDGMVLGGGQRDEDGDRTVMFWDPAIVEGHVYVDGEPVADAEVFFSNQVGPQHTCTDADGYYRFDSSVVLSLVREGLAATGRAVSPETGCANPEFLDAAGLPLVTASVPGPFDLWDGYEYIRFDVERAAALQQVVVEEFDGADWVPADGVAVMVFDLSDPEFVAAYGMEPDPSHYEEILGGGIGQIAHDFTGVYLTEPSGTVELRYAYATNLLILVEYVDGSILGDRTDAAEFIDRGDGVFVGPTILFPNKPPEITNVAGPAAPSAIGNTTSIAATFVDANVHDEHTATVDWGDGTEVDAPAAVDGLVAAEHMYEEPGVYEVLVTVTDAGDLSDTAAFRYVVIYDPSGGFSTGGGWLRPDEVSEYPGIDPADQVNFGFNVKYQANSSQPQGNLNVQLGDLHLKSDAMSWLVITIEDWAHFQGVATVDGGAELYPFRVDVRDGDVYDVEPDLFSLRVWAPGDDPTAVDPLYQVNGDLMGGQITIHR